MGIKRYFADQDNTITNAFKTNLLTRGTGSNMGASDILEAFVIHGQTSASVNATNAEQSRILIQFPIDSIVSDIADGTIPSSSVEYRLKMFNAPHADSLPYEYSLKIAMLSKSWTEGRGLDMNEYSDAGPCNWINSADGTGWEVEGGDYFNSSSYSSSFHFSGGIEDIDVDVTFALDRWRTDGAGTATNYGFMLKHPDSIISGSSGSYYTKKFFGRTSEYFLKRPYIEARWDSARKDQRGMSFISSALAPAADNLNKVYLYNKIRGQLKDIPSLVGTEQKIYVSFFSSSNDNLPSGHRLHVLDAGGLVQQEITGGIVVENGVAQTGIYSCSFAITSSLDVIHDVWHSGSIEYFTGSIDLEGLSASFVEYETQHLSDITNLKKSYVKGQKPVFRVYAREKNWNPNIYTLAASEPPTQIIEDAYWRLFRVVDNLEVVPYGTGTYNHTRMSYDVSGNYFDLDTSILDQGYAYGFQFVYHLNGKYVEQPEIFKFKVDEEPV